MKRNIFNSCVILCFLVACNVPEDKRASTKKRATELEADIYSRDRTSYIPTSSDSTTTSTQAGNQVSVDQGNSTGAANESIGLPKMKGSCTWSQDGVTGFNNLSQHLAGHYIICQSEENDKNIYIQLNRPQSNTSICFVPTHNFGSKSVYIGEPRCRSFSSSTTIYKIELFTNRRNYQETSVTGVMIMKDINMIFAPPFGSTQEIKIPDAYIFCSEYLAQYGDPSFCLSFRNKAEYLYKQF